MMKYDARVCQITNCPSDFFFFLERERILSKRCEPLTKIHLAQSLLLKELALHVFCKLFTVILIVNLWLKDYFCP